MIKLTIITVYNVDIFAESTILYLVLTWTFPVFLAAADRELSYLQFKPSC